MKFGHVRISFCRLNERMIVHDSFWASGFAENGLKPRSNPQMATAVLQSGRNKTVILMTVMLKARKEKKLALEKWSVSSICKLIND